MNRNEQYEPGRIVVIFTEGVTEGEAIVFLRVRGMQNVTWISDNLSIMVVDGIAEGEEDRACARLNRSDMVEIAERAPRRGIVS